MRRKGYDTCTCSRSVCLSVCLSVTTLTATYLDRLRVQNVVLQGSLRCSKRMYCAEFTENASFASFGVFC
jgi:hypothetical protein